MTERTGMKEVMKEGCEMDQETGLERKFARFGSALNVTDGRVIEGYASLFGACDTGHDIVRSGAYAASLKAAKQAGRRVKMLWQHDPSTPIGVWEEVREDERGLYVKGRLLETVQKGREASALIEAGAIDGLSIGYRTVRARKTQAGKRVLSELDLWEVSLVTFPMLPSARVAAKADQVTADMLRALAETFDSARQDLARR
jgi:Escherichia/Staphylococcus phage prohead protease